MRSTREKASAVHRIFIQNIRSRPAGLRSGLTLKVVIEYLSPDSGPGASKIKIKCGEPGKLRGYSLNLSRLIGLFNLLDEKNGERALTKTC